MTPPQCSDFGINSQVVTTARTPGAPWSLPGKTQDAIPLLKGECTSQACGIGSKPEKQTKTWMHLGQRTSWAP